MAPNYEPLRYTKTPWGWLQEDLDLRRGPSPVTRIRCGASVHILGWVIASEREMLAIKILNGQPFSLATTDSIPIDTDDLHSNPRRSTEGEDDAG